MGASSLGFGSWRFATPACVTPQSANTDAALAEARRMSGARTDKVRSLLMEELSKGGHESAVRVCAEVAQELPRAFAERTGHYIRRVSLGYRNPKDRPDEYEQKQLKLFDQRNRENKPEAEYYEVLEEKGQPYLRYLKPLVAGVMCVKCHGPKEEIAPSLLKVLQEKYPQDRAFGYHAGNMRGAVSVRIKMNAEQK